MMEISTVIPAYNEEGEIERLLRDLSRVYSENGYRGDIIVINDCSTDRTLEICNNLRKDIPNLRVISHERNMGKTVAVLNGIKLVRTPYIFMLDADYQYDPFDMPKLVEKVEQGYKIVSGWRHERKDPKIRLLVSWMFNFLDRIMFGIKLHDINCGFKIFRTDIFKGMEFRFDQFFFIDTELLAQAYKKKVPVAEVKISHHPREKDASKVKVITSGIEILINCLRLRFNI